MHREGLSYEYIRGLVDGEGCFTFHSVPRIMNGQPKKVKIPAFVIGMSERDERLLELVAKTLHLKGRIYKYRPRLRKDGYIRQGMAILVVRDFGQLKNIVVPLFRNMLVGNKAKQFSSWIERIADDPDVPQIYKLIPKLCKNGGFYDKNPRFD